MKTQPNQKTAEDRIIARKPRTTGRLTASNIGKHCAQSWIIRCFPKNLLLFVLLLLSARGVLLGDTPVSGVIAGATWTKAAQPYLVVGDILVSTLTIQPGVTVKFASNYSFTIGNRLTAVGTAVDPIVFTPTNWVAGWGGIFFDSAGSASELGFCRVDGAVNSGLRVHASAPNIHDGQVISNSVAGPGGGIWTDSPVTLIRCLIANNNALREGGGIWSSATLTITDCNVTTNLVTGTSTAGGGVFVTGILTMTGATVSDNRIAAFRYDNSANC